MPTADKARAATRGLALGLLLCVARLCAADRSLISWQGETMGGVYTVKIVEAQLEEKQAEALKTEVDQRLKEVNRQMSHYQPESELSRFNRAPAQVPFKISAEFAMVLRLALDLNRRSNGAFDPTLGPVINLWGFGEKTSLQRTPPEADLAKALNQVGCRHLRLSAEDQVVKDIPALGLNLSAIAKGFGVDEMARALAGRGLTNFYVSISGEVFTSGHNAQGTNWQVGIAAPVLKWAPGDPTAAVVSLSGQALSTSGDAQKFFIDEKGRRLCHIFDPRTGHPVQHNLGSVSVVADTCALADGLSTTLFVLGPEAGLRFVEGQSNAAALFIVREPAGTFRQVPSSRFTRLTGYRP
jgi:FAD:protein FMN transferase